MGRVVITHSTYIDGLIKILKSLEKISEIGTITPGVIRRVRSKSERLDIRLTRKTKVGYKLIARKGYSAQEIYIISSLDESEVNRLIRKNL